MTAINHFNLYASYFSILYVTSFGLECYKNPNINDPGPVIITKTGVIIGKYTKVLDKEIATFQGIPFAKPPLGEKRFLKPEPLETSERIYFAKKKSPACMQYSTRNFDWIPSRIEVSEDCLYLNIWLPPACCCNRMDKLPVMVWIHGGGHSAGSASMDLYDGSVLAAYGDAIVVTLNYRLGVFGFLNLDTKEASGNMGLHDNILALKWIQDNIENFGGNPNSITLFGESAGSKSASLLMLSPLSRNFFHKVILQSNTAHQKTILDDVNASFAKGMALAELVNCSIQDLNLKTPMKDVLDCLKKKSAVELSEAENTFTSKTPGFFLPSYGNKCEGCNKLFLEHPIKTIQSGNFLQIPTFVGVTQNEGTIFLAYRKPDVFKLEQEAPLTLLEAKQILQFLIKNSQIPSEEIFDYYLRKTTQPRSEDYVKIIAAIYGDVRSKCPTMYFADKMKDVYFYWYTHRSSKDTSHEWVGATHFAEVAYVFGKPILDTQNYTSEDRQFSEDIIRKFSSFARYGYPFQVSVQVWPKYVSSSRLVYELNPRSRGIMRLPGKEECEFLWPYFNSSQFWE